MPDRILITTDDLEHAVRSNAALEAAGFHTTMASTLDEARQALRRDPPPDCVVVTGGLHESGAAQLLTLARDRSVSTLGLVEETEPDAKGLARRLGLTGYLEKPADPSEVAATVRRLIERRKLQQRTGIIGESPAIQEVLVKIEQMAPVSATVLIEGESGTGKELVARAIHDLSPRRAKPFIAVNCAAIPDTLLESELFGLRRERSPAPPSGGWVASSWPTAAPSSSTRSGRWRPRRRLRPCGCSRTGPSSGWAARRRSRWTCGSSRRRTSRSRKKSPWRGSATTCSTG